MFTRLVLLLTLAVFSLVPACSSGTPADAPPDKSGAAADGTEANDGLLMPRLEVVEPEADLGEVARGKVAPHVFVLKNTGNAPLEIRQVRASCGCTAAVLDNKIIPPGGEGKIDVKLSTQGFSGKISKPVTVQTNDPHNPNMRLTVSATVRVDLDFERPFLRLHPARIGETVTDTVPIVVNVSEKVVFSPPVTDMEGLSVSLVEESGADGRVTKALRAAYTPTKAGRFNGSVTLKTDHPDHPELLIRAVATVRGDIEFSPANLQFTEDGAQTLETILSSAKQSFKILKVSDSQGMVDAVVETKTPGKAYTLKITRNAKAAELGRGFSSWLRVETDNPSQPMVEIPVVSVVRPKPPVPREAAPEK